MQSLSWSLSLTMQSLSLSLLLVHKSLIGHSPAYISDLLTSAADVPGRPALRTCHGQIGSSETEHSVSPLHECGVDCQPTSDSCVRRRHSGAILRHFYSLLLTDIHGPCNAPSVYCRRRIENVLITVTVTVTQCRFLPCELNKRQALQSTKS